MRRLFRPDFSSTSGQSISIRVSHGCERFKWNARYARREPAFCVRNRLRISSPRIARNWPKSSILHPDAMRTPILIAR